MKKYLDLIKQSLMTPTIKQEDRNYKNSMYFIIFFIVFHDKNNFYELINEFGYYNLFYASILSICLWELNFVGARYIDYLVAKFMSKKNGSNSL